MMQKRDYRFAGVELRVEMAEERMYRNQRWLAPFETEGLQDPYVFNFEVQENLPQPKGKLLTEQPGFRVYEEECGHVRYVGTGTYSSRVEHSGKQYHVQVQENDYTDIIRAKTVLECIGAEHLIARNDGFIFHCSYIDHQGKAILFTAPSETGKSTQAELWRSLRGAEIINGDRAAVRLVDGTLMAEGIPFAGSSQYCLNRSLPIEAIVYLGQAPKTTIRKMRGYEAFSKIWEGVSVNTWDKEDMERVSHVVQQAAEKIPVYHLPCTPDESAVIALEQMLRKQECV